MAHTPAMFQCLMNVVLGDVPNSEAYLDDVVVYSDTLEQHVHLMEMVFAKLCDAPLVLNIEKCESGNRVAIHHKQN